MPGRPFAVGLSFFAALVLACAAGVFCPVAVLAAADVAIESIDRDSVSFRRAMQLKAWIADSERCGGLDAYRPVLFVRGRMNGLPVFLYRFQPPDSPVRRFHGPHLSLLLDEQGNLRGMARVDPSLAGKPAVDRDLARKTARRFIERYAPDLAPSLPSERLRAFPLRIAPSSGDVVIDGVMAKYRNRDDGRYFFVIVAPDGRPMIFDRAGERWLYDDWLEERLRGLP
jgi:hypothetical protein